MSVLRRFSAVSLLPVLSACLVASASAQTAYPQPDPSADEQYMLERINSARANPAVEGVMLASQVGDPTIAMYYSHYGVSTAELVSDFASYPTQPPLAMNAQLMASANRESVDMATHGFQSHTGSDGSTFTQRISAAGYNWGGAGENIYAYSEGAFFGHVGFNADWGVPSYDHRANIMNNESNYPLYREVGISCVPSSKPGYGPMVITQDFAKPMSSGVAYVLGVVYADNNNNGLYTQGEGLASVTVTTDTGSTYAATASAGGFVLPLPASGSGVLTVTASGGGLGAPRAKQVAWTAGTNVKVDFTTADAPSTGTPTPVPVPVIEPPAAPALPTLSVAAAIKTANGNTGRAGVVIVARDGDLSSPLRVPLTFTGTAVNGVDFTQLPNFVVIPAGESWVNVVIESTNADPVRKAVSVNIKLKPTSYLTSTGAALHGKITVSAAVQ